jgi:AraC family transcriptional activator of pobA
MSSNKLPVLSVKSFKKPLITDPDFYIKTFPEHKAEHPFIMEPHRHDFYMLMLFTKGKGKHIIDLKKYDVTPGSVFFMSPGEMHSWTLSNDTDGFVLMFNTSFFTMNVNNRSINEFPFFSLKNKMHCGKLKPALVSSFKALLKTIHLESKADLKQQTQILRAYLDILLLKLTAVFPSNANNGAPLSVNMISKLEALIENNYKNHLPVSFYAGALSISPVQLNVLSNNQLNRSVSDLIHERLFSEAKRLLAYTDLTANEISNQLNFNDNSYFNRFFKKASGHTPEQFRKRLLIP